jgi:molecular chaperone DnaK
MTESKVVYGIDLGTTNSCLAKFENGKTTIVEIDGASTVPSVVAFDGENYLVGRKAHNYSRLFPDRAISSIKRQMGNQNFSFHFGNDHHESLTPVQISAKILTHLKLAAIAQHQLDVEKVVITVPAYFNDIQRRATLDAGKLAGFDVLKIINEPTAAALSYEGHTIINQEVHDEELWAIYDLGGGTFDVSLVKSSGELKEVLSISGNNFLGGDDFDRLLAERLLHHLKNQYNEDFSEDKVVMARLHFWAETAKIKLSEHVQVELSEEFSFKEKKYHLNYTITREHFEELISDLVYSTISKFEEALENAHLKVGDIHKCILVGGSTKIPFVQRVIKEKLGLEGGNYVDPDLAVALGAGIQAAIKAGLKYDKIVFDVTAYSLGVACVGFEDKASNPEELLRQYFQNDESEDNEEEDVKLTPFQKKINKICSKHPQTFAPIVPRNAKLPASMIRTFYTAFDGQKRIEVVIYQGESARTKENLFIGSFLVDLVGDNPAGTPIHIQTKYDLNGIISIAVLDPSQKNVIGKHVMNLNYDPLQNSEFDFNPDSDIIDSDDNDDEFDFINENDDAEIKVNEESEKENFLLLQVKEKLIHFNEGSEKSAILNKISSYKELLSGDFAESSQLDKLEDDLYEWLGNNQNTDQDSQ